MKVLHLTSGNLFGGIETYLLTLARLRHLCPQMEPHFGVCFPGRLREELLAAGVPVHDLGPVRASRPWTVLRGRSRLRSILRENAIAAAVTHGTWPHAMFGPVVKRVGVRLVNLFHNAPSGRHWIDRWAARTPPDAVVANSRFTAECARRMFPRTPVEVIYYPVTMPQVDTSVRSRVRQSFNVPDDTVVILQTSRLERWKGQAEHLAALAKLASLPNWSLWVAGGVQKPGEDAFLAELKSFATSAGIADRVVFLGQRSDVPQLMTAADIFCQPNAGPEPFGIVFVEALHSGLPVVTSNFGGGAEIVTDSCGILCPPMDADSLAAALRQLIEDPTRRKRLGAAGPSRVAELCEPTRQMAALASIGLGAA